MVYLLRSCMMVYCPGRNLDNIRKIKVFLFNSFQHDICRNYFSYGTNSNLFETRFSRLFERFEELISKVYASIQSYTVRYAHILVIENIFITDNTKICSDMFQ